MGQGGESFSSVANYPEDGYVWICQVIMFQALLAYFFLLEINVLSILFISS